MPDWVMPVVQMILGMLTKIVEIVSNHPAVRNGVNK